MLYSTAEFETLYIGCFPQAMRLAVSLLHEEDEARDVVQEVFLKLWESDIRIDNPIAFIIRAVRNSCLNRISILDNREKIRQKLLLDYPPDDINIEQRNNEVLTAISRLLTPREQQIVNRIFSDGMSYKETAEDLGVSVAAVNKHIVGALKKLRNHFKAVKS